MSKHVPALPNRFPSTDQPVKVASVWPFPRWVWPTVLGSPPNTYMRLPLSADAWLYLVWVLDGVNVCALYIQCNPLPG